MIADDDEKNCFLRETLISDLEIIKNFIWFYISISKEQLFLKSIWSSVLNFVERFLSDFKWVTKTEIDTKNRNDVFKVQALSHKYQDIALLICVSVSEFIRL